MEKQLYHNVWDEITYPFPNINDIAFEVWKWITKVIDVVQFFAVIDRHELVWIYFWKKMSTCIFRLRILTIYKDLMVWADTRDGSLPHL